MDIPGPGRPVIAAAMAVATGLCRHVLCFRTVWQSTFAALAALGAKRGGGGHAGLGAVQRVAFPFGAMSAANWIGMNAEQYLHRYGAPRDARADRRHRTCQRGLNPHAIYRDPMTMDDYLAARPITSPFGLYDCDVPCDGSIAVIVSDASVARRPAASGGPDGGGRHADPRAAVVGPGHGHARAAGPGPGRPPVDPHRSASVRRRPRAASTTDSPSMRSRGSRVSGSAGSARRTTGWTAGGGSRWTASSRSTPTAGSSRRGALHGFGFIYEAVTAAASRRRRAAGGRTRRRPLCPPAGAPLRGRSLAAKGVTRDESRDRDSR